METVHTVCLPSPFTSSLPPSHPHPHSNRFIVHSSLLISGISNKRKGGAEVCLVQGRMQQAMLGVQQGKTRHNNSRSNAHTCPDFSTQFKAPQGSGKGGGGGGPKAAGSAGATQCINYHPTTNHNHRPEVLRAWSCCENKKRTKNNNKKNKEDSVGEKKKKKKKRKDEGRNTSRRWLVNESLEM